MPDPSGRLLHQEWLIIKANSQQVPTSIYYLHRGHTWAVPEDTGLVRVGLDAFSQKILGPADEVKFPEVGKVYYQDHVCLALEREGHKASIEAPLAAFGPGVFLDQGDPELEEKILMGSGRRDRAG